MKLTFLVLIAVSAAAQQPLHLNLEQARQLAIQNNPRFASAKFTAAAAGQVTAEYRSAYQPTAYGSITAAGADDGSRIAAGGLNNPSLYSRLGTGVAVTQMLTDFGRTGNLVAMAKLRAEAQNQATETTRSQVLLGVSAAYYALLRARAVLAVALQTVDARKLVADQLAALAENKLRSTLDVSFANVNLSEARLLLLHAQSDVKAAEADLAAAIGLPNQPSFELEAIALPAPLPAAVEELLTTALQNRPELRDLRLQASAAERFTRAEQALYYPTVSAAGVAGLAPAAVQQVPGRYGAVAVNVNIPILNGGLFKARRTEADLKAQAAARNITDLENRVGRDVRVAYLNATVALEHLALTRELLAQSRLALDLAQTRYDLGLGSIVELSQAQLAFTSAQLGNAAAGFEYQTDRVVDFTAGTLR